MAKSRFVDLEPKDDHKQYEVGFNRGYLLAQVMPGLAEEIGAIKSNAPGIRGIRDGSNLFQLEIKRDVLVNKKVIESEKASMNFSDDSFKAYNQGYIIAEKMPELVSLIMTAEGLDKQQNMQDLKLGIKNCLQDKMMNISTSFTKVAKDTRKNNEPDKTNEKGKDPDLDR